MSPNSTAHLLLTCNLSFRNCNALIPIIIVLYLILYIEHPYSFGILPFSNFLEWNQFPFQHPSHMVQKLAWENRIGFSANIDLKGVLLKFPIYLSIGICSRSFPKCPTRPLPMDHNQVFWSGAFLHRVPMSKTNLLSNDNSPSKESP